MRPKNSHKIKYATLSLLVSLHCLCFYSRFRCHFGLLPHINCQFFFSQLPNFSKHYPHPRPCLVNVPTHVYFGKFVLASNLYWPQTSTFHLPPPPPLPSAPPTSPTLALPNLEQFLIYLATETILVFWCTKSLIACNNSQIVLSAPPLFVFDRSRVSLPLL